MKFTQVGEMRRLATLQIKEVRASQVPDDVQLLNDLVAEGLVVGTPPQDYDDSYCLTYARKHDGFVVSNDLYRCRFGHLFTRIFKCFQRPY